MGETRTIAIEVPATVAEELAEIARTTEQTTADLARQALDQFLDHEAWRIRAHIAHYHPQAARRTGERIVETSRRLIDRLKIGPP